MPRCNLYLEHSEAGGHIAAQAAPWTGPMACEGVTMRRFALISLTLGVPAFALSGCGLASSPFNGFGGFVGDTHTVSLRTNMPVGDSENLRRVTGREVATEPLTTEPGNVWPGPPPPEPTLEDIERQQNTGEPLGSSQAPPPVPDQSTPVVPHPQPRPYTRGSSTPPTPVVPAVPDLAPTPPPQPGIPQQPAPRSGTFQTPQGPVQVGPATGGVQTYAAPGGGTGIVVPNGNGTSTLVGPDGSVRTVPNPR